MALQNLHPRFKSGRRLEYRRVGVGASRRLPSGPSLRLTSFRSRFVARAIPFALVGATGQRFAPTSLRPLA
jgi:hypothetical protein